eukprot:16436435-Heterocapsa_arctica.AAC.1
MMFDGNGTRANRLEQHGMLAMGAVGSFEGTTAEILKQLLATEPNVFRTLGPYETVPEPIQADWPDWPAPGGSTPEARYRSRSNEQRARGGK